jgi:hypothetical protein
MAGPVSNYNDEILAAMNLLQRYGAPVLGGSPSEGFTTKNLEEDPLVRALQAATAQLSAQENEQLPEDAPRITQPLDRAAYRGS